MKNRFSVFLVILCSLYLTSCATLFKGSSEEINFNSNPTGAEVWIDGKMMGHTPYNLNLITKKIYIIEFKFNGQTKTVNLNNHVGAGWVVLDVLAGLVPIIIDAVTGAWYGLDQKNVNVDFRAPGVFVPSRP
jgi:hypothetical protein